MESLYYYLLQRFLLSVFSRFEPKSDGEEVVYLTLMDDLPHLGLRVRGKNLFKPFTNMDAKEMM